MNNTKIQKIKITEKTKFNFKNKTKKISPNH